jgi:hypothetical protein
MDNIRLDSKTSLSDSPNFFIGIGTKSSQPLSILHYLYQTQILRELIGRFFPMKYVEKLVPKYGMVIQIDATGEVLETLHGILYIYIYMHIFKRIYIYVHMYICIYIYIHIHVFFPLFLSAYVYE